MKEAEAERVELLLQLLLPALFSWQKKALCKQEQEEEEGVIEWGYTNTLGRMANPTKEQ